MASQNTAKPFKYMHIILAKRDGNFFFFSLISYTLCFLLRFPFWVLPALTSTYSKISQSQNQANPGLKSLGSLKQDETTTASMECGRCKQELLGESGLPVFPVTSSLKKLS